MIVTNLWKSKGYFNTLNNTILKRNFENKIFGSEPSDRFWSWNRMCFMSRDGELFISTLVTVDKCCSFSTLRDNPQYKQDEHNYLSTSYSREEGSSHRRFKVNKHIVKVRKTVNFVQVWEGIGFGIPVYIKCQLSKVLILSLYHV